MGHDENAQPGAQAEKQEPVLPVRMVRIVDQERNVVCETVSASSKETPCFLLFESAFFGSHSNRSSVTHTT